MTSQKHSKFAATALTLAISPMAAIAQPMLEEVIVTAQKRAESLQDVPISVSAMSGEKINNTGITPRIPPTCNHPRIRPTTIITCMCEGMSGWLGVV